MWAQTKHGAVKSTTAVGMAFAAGMSPVSLGYAMIVRLLLSYSASSLRCLRVGVKTERGRNKRKQTKEERRTKEGLLVALGDEQEERRDANSGLLFRVT